MAKRVRTIPRGGALTGLVVLIALILPAAAAQAATVQIGSPLTASFTPGSFSSQQVTIVQRTLPEPGVNIVNPVDGHIVSYRLGPSNGTFALQVIHYEGTAARSEVTSPLTQVSTSGISDPIPTNLPIQRGELIGIKVNGGSDLLAGAQNGSAFSVWSPALEDGGAERNPDFNSASVEFGFGATVRYCRVPDVLGKNPREARQTLAAADCRVGDVVKTKKRSKRKNVIFQSVAAGNAVSDTRQIDLRIARKRHR